MFEIALLGFPRILGKAKTKQNRKKFLIYSMPEISHLFDTRGGREGNQRVSLLIINLFFTCLSHSVGNNEKKQVRLKPVFHLFFLFFFWEFVFLTSGVI